MKLGYQWEFSASASDHHRLQDVLIFYDTKDFIFSLKNNNYIWKL